MIEEIKRLREEWNPQREGIRIRVLFIGESPPKNTQRFFYKGNSILYYATRRAFIEKFEEFGVRIPVGRFLHFFKKLGCYLVDLFEENGKKVNNASYEELVSAKSSLNNFVQRKKEQGEIKAIIVVVKRVYNELDKQGLVDEWKRKGIKVFSLPFPLGKYYQIYISELKKIIDDLLKQNVITLSEAENILADLTRDPN
jgi:hypothetical protein